jgi:ATP-binding cassette, subfamily B, bacterial
VRASGAGRRRPAVIDGQISLGEFVTFYGYGGMLAGAAGMLGYLAYLTASASGSAGRIVELLDHPGAGDGGQAPARVPESPHLSLRWVSMSRQGAESPLQDVSFDVSSGETVALVGATDAGMRTLLEIVNGLLAPDSGEVELDGRPLDRAERPLLRGLSAPAGQDPLFAMSIAENIAYGRPEASQADVERAARLAHADEIVHRLSVCGLRDPGGRGGRAALGRRAPAGRAGARAAARSFCWTTSRVPKIRTPPTGSWTGSPRERRAPPG